MLTRLSLSNFKRHMKEEFKFSERLNVISGANYSGKSTILHGVLFALFGTSAVPGGTDVIKNRKGSKPAYVELDFEIEGQEYRIERSTGKVRLFRGDEMIASSASAVTQKVEELIGLDKKRFLQLRYSAQKHTEALLTLGAAELHSVIEEVSGADLVSYVIDRAGDIASECKGGLDTLPEIDLGSLKADLKTLGTEIKTLGEKSKKLDAQLSKANEALEGAKQARSKAQRNNSVRRELLGKVQEAQEGLAIAKAAHTEAMADYNDNREMAQRYDRYKEKKTELESRISKAVQTNREFEALDVRGKGLGQEIEAKREKLEELKATLASLDFDPAQLFQLREQHAEVNSAHKQAKAEFQRLDKSIKESYCHACKRLLDGAEVEELVKQAGEAQRKEVELAAKAKDLRDHVVYLEKLEERWSGLQKQILTIEADIRAKDEEVGRIQHQMDELEEKTNPQDVIDVWQSNLLLAADQFNKAIAAKDRVMQASKKLERSNNRISLLAKQIEEVGEVPEEVAIGPLDESVEQNQQAVDGLKSEYRDTTSAKQYADLRHKEISDQIERAEKVESKRRHLEGRLKTSQELAKYLRKNRDRFLMEIWDGVMGYASHFVSACTDNAIESVSRLENGKFAYVEAEETMPIEAASGAQRSLMGLGVQMALSQMLPTPFDGVLLDEPTSDMDGERSMAMAMMLANAKSQVLMVSHREMDNSVASHNISLGGV